MVRRVDFLAVPADDGTFPFFGLTRRGAGTDGVGAVRRRGIGGGQGPSVGVVDAEVVRGEGCGGGVGGDIFAGRDANAAVGRRVLWSRGLRCGEWTAVSGLEGADGVLDAVGAFWALVGSWLGTRSVAG